MVKYKDNMAGYEINQKDIDAVISFLKETDPENATPEMAISILEHLKGKFHTLAHENPEKLKEILENLKKTKKVI